MFQHANSPRTGQMSALGRHLRWFARDCGGSLVVLGLFIFVAMLLVAGLAVDMARYEHERIRMQGAADRAALAATMLRTNPANPSPAALAEAYFVAEGLSGQLGGRVDVVETAHTGRTVTVVPAAAVPSTFMRLVGVNSLSMATPAQANEAIAGQVQLEVVMVLDISGSMNTNNRIANMRNAAAELAETLFEGTEPGQVALSLVPYNDWVLPPAGFIAHFENLPAGSGACIDFQSWNSVTNSLSAAITRHSCNTTAWRRVVPYLHDLDSALGVINAMQAGGTTSIDLGVRFGALFFDPDIRPAITQMISNGDIDAVFEGRPMDWRAPGVVRAMVLLTDGENCCGARFARAQQDANTVAACNALKDQGIIIYAVAFEAPAGGITMMQQCASSENHFSNTSGSGLADIFEGIGNHLVTQSLRLTR